MPSTSQSRSSVVGPAPSDLHPLTSEVGSLSSVLGPQPKARLVYILAASHSGSTLLAMLLGTHPQAWTSGELKGASNGRPDAYRCSCRERIRECGFWQKISAAMRARGHFFEVTSPGTDIQEAASSYARRLLRPLYRVPALEFVRDALLMLSPQWPKHLHQNQNRNAALVESLIEVSGAEIVIDSSKTGLRLKYLLRNPDLKVPVIRLIRDGRAVSLTHTNPAEFADATDPRLRFGGTGVVRPNFRLSMEDAALLWKRSNEEADRLISTLDDSQFITIQYEQLCLKPAETIQSICEFLDIEPYEPGDDFRHRKQQHIVGNGMRFDASSEIHLDDRWRTHLTADDLQVFDRFAGDLNRRYGYV